MVGIKDIERKLLLLPLKQRVFLAESLLDSVASPESQMTEGEELAEVERREEDLETGRVQPLNDADFWRAVDEALTKPHKSF